MASTLPYGPQSAAVRAMLVQLAGLGAADRARVVAAHTALCTTRAWVTAERQLAETMARSDREAYREALSGPLLQLVRVPDAPTPQTEEEALATLDPVAEPALAALLAVLVQDLLPPDTVRTLCAPFADVLSATSPVS
ncbi:MAG: hypothetical protein K2R93_16455 [Gemmatimonadaceae bacterium]|nr:hypothetical protein [Gemmatimonadaceae bacterium]